MKYLFLFFLLSDLIIASANIYRYIGSHNPIYALAGVGAAFIALICAIMYKAG